MVFVPKYVPDAGDAAPSDAWMHSLQMIGHVTAGFRNDFNRPLSSMAEQPILLKISKRLTSDCCLYPVDRDYYFVQNRCNFACHQNTRTADFSMSSRNIGCKLSRVVTSTSKPSLSSSKKLDIDEIQSVELPIRIVIDKQVEVAIGIVFIPCCRTKQKKRGSTECLNGISVAFEFGDRLSPIHVLNNTNNLYFMAIVCSLARIAFASLSAPRPERQLRLVLRVIEYASRSSSSKGRRRGYLFWLFWPVIFAQPHTRAAAVLVDEFNAGGFESAVQRLDDIAGVVE